MVDLSDLPLALRKILQPKCIVFSLRIWPFWHFNGKIDMFMKTSNLARIKHHIDSPVMGSRWDICSAHSSSSCFFPFQGSTAWSLAQTWLAQELATCLKGVSKSCSVALFFLIFLPIARCSSSPKLHSMTPRENKIALAWCVLGSLY